MPAKMIKNVCQRFRPRVEAVLKVGGGYIDHSIPQSFIILQKKFGSDPIKNKKVTDVFIDF